MPRSSRSSAAARLDKRAEHLATDGPLGDAHRPRCHQTRRGLTLRHCYSQLANWALVVGAVLSTPCPYEFLRCHAATQQPHADSLSNFAFPQSNRWCMETKATALRCGEGVWAEVVKRGAAVNFY